ncbi:MAG: hypothetical protein GXP28_01035 [Planctomycetes bacterium]|nr:hypothetical protein [Planctomycetota bacterium]
MRDEISEPQQWRSSTRRKMGETTSRVLPRQSAAHGLGSIAALPVEAIDAVFADELVRVEPARGSRRDMVSQKPADRAVVAESMRSAEGNDLLQSLSAQLAMLKTQQEHLQELLVQAQEVR